MKRRKFVQSTAGVFLLAGIPGHRVDGVELVYDRQRTFPMMKETVPPDAVRMLGGYLEAFSPPKGMMAADGGWTAVYDIVRFFTKAPYEEVSGAVTYNTVMGQVAIGKPASAPDYEVQMSYRPTPSLELVKARIACADSPVAALKSWELEWECQGGKTELSYTNHERAVVAADHFSVASFGKTERFELKQPLTCLWPLMDAVRWLPPETGWSHGFDMYMDLSTLRRNQSLSFAGRGQVALATGLQNMNFYEQLGEGTTPIHYAVDDQQRTLFVTQGQLGWALNRIEGI